VAPDKGSLRSAIQIALCVQPIFTRNDLVALTRNRASVQRLKGARDHIGLAVMLAGIFVTVMDGSIVSVALPSIRTTLGATFAEAELVIAGYIFISPSA
jgi:hypothetical protein